MGGSNHGRAVELTNGQYTLKVNSDGSIDAKATPVVNSSLIQGNLTLDASTQQLAADVACKVVTVQADPTNVDVVYVGNASLTGAAGAFGAQLSPGSSMTFTVTNVNAIYVKGTNAEKVSYIGEV